MIDAEMNNKIPKLETWEDILTSNVFGVLELIEYKHLLNVISIAKNEKNEKVANKIKDKKIKTVQLWKHFKNIGEPDILVKLDDGTFFIIEVKYFSHEHNNKDKAMEENSSDDVKEYQENGQLARYLEIEIDKQKSDFIIYLTADYQSMKYIKESNSSSKNCLNKIYHIHWDEFNEYLQKIQNLEGIEKKVIHKIIEYLDFKGFEYWKGFHYKKEYDIEITTGGFYENK
ncbi:hypothetical protein [Sulfurimonas hydrogeniphila]|uniref:hypothetical protein n=1 Tax=Sulfurimonas hydrogeniphila TaxID=2509341 RepID=UPI00125F5B73|nr:hypothetical protein [Sulfurimonas hydrogeniphila]